MVQSNKGFKKALVYVKCTINNTRVTIVDTKGNVISWATGGTTGATGSRRSTAFTGQKVAYNAAKKAMEKGVSTVDVILDGFGKGRMVAPKGLQIAGLNITSIRNLVKEPFNGCRGKKIRRVLFIY